MFVERQAVNTIDIFRNLLSTRKQKSVTTENKAVER